VTTGGGSGDDDDPLMSPASDAGWSDEPKPTKPATTPPPTAPAPAGSVPPPAQSRRDLAVTTGSGSSDDDPPPTPAPPALVVAISPSTAPEKPTATPALVVAIAPSTSLPPSTPGDATSLEAKIEAMRSSRRASPSFPAFVPPASPTPVPAAPAEATANAKPAAPEDEPLLPPSYDVNALRSAVGASPLVEPAGRRSSTDRDDDDDDLPHARNRKPALVAAATIVVGVGIAAIVVLGYFNSTRYLLACEAERAVPEQGRRFPPWGSHALDGEAWKPLKIPARTRCQVRETDDALVLERLYLAMVLDQATAMLTAREVTQVDDAEALLKQGLLLTRPVDGEPAKLAAERNQHHADVEHLLGDVGYWRAKAKLRDATAGLADAAKQFEAAAAQHPVHVSDAPAWASYARRLAQELRSGPAAPVPPPAAGSPSPPPTAEHPGVPVGTELPIEPAAPSEPAPALDAGVSSTGGVLL
jgi:hypothetical protein